MQHMTSDQREVVEAYLRTREARLAEIRERNGGEHDEAEMRQASMAARQLVEIEGQILAAFYPEGLLNEEVFAALSHAAKRHYQKTHEHEPMLHRVNAVKQGAHIISTLADWGLMPGQPGAQRRHIEKIDRQTREQCEFLRDTAIQMVRRVFDAIEYDDEGLARGEVRAIRSTLDPPLAAKQRSSHSLLFFYTPTGAAHAWQDDE